MHKKQTQKLAGAIRGAGFCVEGYKLKEVNSMNAWESVFLQSPVNEGSYEEDELPQLNWEWPRETWFQTRLDHVREHGPVLRLKSYRKFNRQGEQQAA
jgi:hypothetical protein